MHLPTIPLTFGRGKDKMAETKTIRVARKVRRIVGRHKHNWYVVTFAVAWFEDVCVDCGKHRYIKGERVKGTKK
jgi:hypothetical protein